MHRFWIVVLLGGLVASTVLPAAAQDWRTMTSSRRLNDRAPHEVDIQYGAGTLTVLPADGQHLYRMEVRYSDEGSRPVAEYDSDDRHLRLGTDGHDFNRGSMRHAEEARATIALSREVPLELDLKFGAGRAEIELGGLSLQQLSIATGASDTRVSFSEANRISADEVQIEAGAADLRVTGLGNARARRVEFKGGVGSTVLDFSGASGNMEADIDMGVGSLTLRLPRSHGIRVERTAFLSSVNTPADLTREGDVYTSSNWASATQRLSIEVSAALGSIDIQWVD